MLIDFTAADVFLAYLDGRASIEEVLFHPAYLTVGRHIQMFSEYQGKAGSSFGDLARTAPTTISEKEFLNSLSGKRSVLYGLSNLSENLPRIREFLTVLRLRAEEWGEAIQHTLAGLFPREMLDITIYPIIGYDKGIGLNGTACLNCNTEAYLARPEEFLFYAIHECTHVLYERHHSIPGLAEVDGSGEWPAYFHLWLQYEGFAVYAPLKLRVGRDACAEPDYQVLFDAGALNRHRRAVLKVLDRFMWDQAISRQEYLRFCFGPRRLTYRVGCELIRRIEKEGGMEAVRQAFYMDGNEFIRTYHYLLKDHLADP